MNTCLLIGAKGFIGSAVAEAARRYGYDLIPVDRGNYEACKGMQADVLINASGNAAKYLDARSPTEGYARSVTSVLHVLQDFRSGCFVQLSSGAVYPDEGDPVCNSEDEILDPKRMSHYGFHKWMAEQLVRHYAPRHLILRMGGFVGGGLKKNAVYDVLHGHPLRVHPDSRFQFMDTQDLAEAVFQLIGRDDSSVPALLNLAGKGTVSVREIAGHAGVCLPAGCESLPVVRAELELAKAAKLLELPVSEVAVQHFLERFRRNEVKLG